MSTTKCAVNVYVLFLGTVLFSLNFGSNTALRTLFVEELCYGSSYAKVNLQFYESVILSSVPTEKLDCQIRIETKAKYSIVVSFYSYYLNADDSLIFKDRHNFQLALTGNGVFMDERKSVMFEAPMTIKYFTNTTQVWNKLKFQFVLTQVHDQPCSSSEFQCRNNKCIPKNLACDQHNHCGDIEYQDNCSLKDKVLKLKPLEQVITKPNVWIISIGVCAGILAIVIIAFIVVLAKGCAKRNKKPKPQELTTVTASHDPQRPVPTVFGRMRQSFRSMRQPTAPPPPVETAPQHSAENYQVPSMYPHLPSVKDGVDNPQFKSDE